MALHPYPFGALVRRAFVEFEREQSIFGLPRRRWFAGIEGLDLSVDVHGTRIATPFGPAAGPHTQLAQNIVLSWLAGGRAIELKTVQRRDNLEIARPCIDMRASGFNVEWSQELSLGESIQEYIKASMLIRMLASAGVLPEAAGGRYFVFDMSVGYDLVGIRSDPMQAFLGRMLDATQVIDRLRRQVPPEAARWRDVDFDPAISRSVTLSTFHGCPPGEISDIVDFLQRTFGVHCTVKFNPSLLGPERVRQILQEFGYTDVNVPAETFTKDLSWEQAVELVEQCGRRAASLGLGFGVKFTNTLSVENDSGPLPASERYRYLSGRALHPMAVELVHDFRARFGNRFPISFSAGVERWNFPDVVALGVKPVTVCTDLLREGGYGRVKGYFTALAERMTAVNARSVDDLVSGAAGVDAYLASLVPAGPLAASGIRPQKKIERHLSLLDCLTCDKCLRVCPNDALFTYRLAECEGVATGARRHQIGVFSDFCNDCGNCETFCPEHGAPYLAKPRFYGSYEAWANARADGFWLTGSLEQLTVRARIGGREYEMDETGGRVRFAGHGFDVTFDPADCDSRREAMDLGPCAIVRAIARGVLAQDAINYISMLQ